MAQQAGLGSKLREARRAFCGKAKVAAKQVGVSAPTWSSWEREKKTPCGEYAVRLEMWTLTNAVRVKRPDLVIRATDWHLCAAPEEVAA